MPCSYPIDAWQTSGGEVVFTDDPRKDPVRKLQLPCGQCTRCRLERSRQWAIRCVHEAQMWTDNCFITLTYDKEHLPAGNTLKHLDYQLFMKRLRRRFFSSRETPIRYYMCGEYGEKGGRPHYHACLFNFNFPDRKPTHKSEKGSQLYSSKLLEQIWGMGRCDIGELNFESAAYAARYIMEKQTGEKATNHYAQLDKDTGEIFKREPEYNKMSLKLA